MDAHGDGGAHLDRRAQASAAGASGAARYAVRARTRGAGEDVIANLEWASDDPERRRKVRGPRPRNKRLAASVKQYLEPRLIEMFDEADRREAGRKREATVLVDGDEHQTDVIKRETVLRGRSLTIVLDLLHAIHYLWLAAKAIRGATSKLGSVDEIVTRWTISLLTGDPARTIATHPGQGGPHLIPVSSFLFHGATSGRDGRPWRHPST